MDVETRLEDGAARGVWKRGLFMLLLMIAFGLGQVVLNCLTVAQFLWLLVAGEPNQFLRRFGGSMAVWLRDVARFQSCASEEKPFPWREWPEAG